MLVDVMQSLLGATRALQFWFHGAHNLTKGTAFSGDHVNLYAPIYEAANDEYDRLAERAVGLTEDEGVACPTAVAEVMLGYLSNWPSPANSSGAEIAKAALQIMREHVSTLEDAYRMLDESSELTLGLDDLLMELCSAHETNVYLLGQRVRSSN